MRATSVWMSAAFSVALGFVLSTAGTQAAGKTPSYIAAAVKDSGRPEADTKRDKDRKPAEALAFSGVKPGDKVAELIPAAGYYTRLLSKVVGPSGHVYMIVPPTPKGPPPGMARPGAGGPPGAAGPPGPGGPGAGAPGAARPPMRRPNMMAMAKAITDNPEYSNVSVVELGPGPAFSLPEPVDVFWTTENYHDLHNLPDADLSVFNKRVFESMKNGGVYFIEDHAGGKGTGAGETKTLHRIEPDQVKKEVTDAGFDYVGQSRALHNPKDTHKDIVFKTADKTDRFMYKFRRGQ